MRKDETKPESPKVSSVQFSKLGGLNALPEGYPKVVIKDSYTRDLTSYSYEERKDLFIKHVLMNPASENVKGFYYELIRISENKGPIHMKILFSTLEFINSRQDCADFALAGIIRLYYQLIDSNLLSDEFKEAAKRTILGFKYWPDEPGIDSMCYWTENHHILFSSCEYLAGQLFKDEIFTNSGMTGKEKMVKAKKRIDKWLYLRFYTGFNEWLSNIYYEEDFPPLLNLLDFSEDITLANKSKVVIDLMLYDMAINSYYGMLSCTHGRTYTKAKLNPYQDATIDISKLMFGMGRFKEQANMSTVVFTLSKKYELPKVIFDIATDTNNLEWINKQRVSIKFKDAKKWGYGKLNLESAMGLLSFGGYAHPRTINHMVLMLDKFNWWSNDFFRDFLRFKKVIKIGKHIKLPNLISLVFKKDISRNVREENNIYTYRTKDYMLSTSQNYRKSYGGDQHHIWKATLDDEAVCFTTHPGGYGEVSPNAYWQGNGFLPKAIQHKNVGVIIYKTPKVPTLLIKKILDFTHAFFPKQRFDKITEKNGWIFGVKNEGYIALRSMKEYYWQNEGAYEGSEVLSKGRKNIWIVEMGNKNQYNSFENFIDKVSKSELCYKRLSVKYKSPSLGEIYVGWNKKLRINGSVIRTDKYMRYDNITSNTPFGSDDILIAYKDAKINLNIKQWTKK